MSRLILGCASFGNVYGKLDYDTCYQLVKSAMTNQIYHFDTSPFYGNSQEILGNIIKQLTLEGFRTNHLVISTKVGRYGEKDFDFSESKTRDSVSTSLKLLNRNYLDIVFCHDIEFANNLDEIIEQTLPTLDELKKKGIIKQIGISGLPLSVLDYVLTKSSIKIDVILTYCSYTLNYSGLLQYQTQWKKKGCQIIHGGVTAMGLLTKQGPPSWHPADEKTKQFCATITKQYPNLTEIAYNYVNKNIDIDKIMIGPCSLEELDSYLGWSRNKEGDQFIENIRELFISNGMDQIWIEPNTQHNLEISNNISL